MKKILSRILSECQIMVWVENRPDIMLDLIRAQNVCKGYQQLTKVASNKERVKICHFGNL